MDAADRFCRQCGQPLPQVPSQGAGQHDGLLGGEFDVAALTRLRRDKARLTAELQALLDAVAGRSMTPGERQIWATLHARWTEVSSDLTERMQYYNARRAYDRRTRDRRLTRERTFPAVDLPDDVPSDRRSADRRRSDRRRPFPEGPPQGSD